MDRQVKKTKKEFRNCLNKTKKNSLKWKHKRYNQRTRDYGDYLYYQDRERFDYYYKVWVEFGDNWESYL